MNIEELRTDNAIKQRKGLHFIIASIFIWLAILLVHLTNWPQLTKNLFTFFCTAPLMPLALLISKYIGADFQNKDNPLSKLGLLFSLNQLLYMLIAMWVFPTVPDKFLMVMAMIFGAHLLPFSWIYRSVSYLVLAIVIPFVSLFVGLLFSPVIVAITMFLFELIFTVSLLVELKGLDKQTE